MFFFQSTNLNYTYSLLLQLTQSGLQLGTILCSHFRICVLSQGIIANSQSCFSCQHSGDLDRYDRKPEPMFIF